GEAAYRWAGIWCPDPSRRRWCGRHGARQESEESNAEYGPGHYSCQTPGRWFSRSFRLSQWAQREARETVSWCRLPATTGADHGTRSAAPHVPLERPAQGERGSQVVFRRSFRLRLVVEGIEQRSGEHEILDQLVRDPDIALCSHASLDRKARVDRAGDSRIEFGMVVA